MTEVLLIKIFYNIVTYKCPHCGEINTFPQSTIDLYHENKIDHIYCEECYSKIKI